MLLFSYLFTIANKNSFMQITSQIYKMSEDNVDINSSSMLIPPQEVSNETNNNRKCKKLLLLSFIIVLIAGFIGFLCYIFFYANQLVSKEESRRTNPWHLIDGTLKETKHNITFELTNTLTMPDPDVLVGRYNRHIRKLRGKVVSYSATLTQLTLTEEDVRRWDVEEVVPLPWEDEQKVRRAKYHPGLSDAGFEFNFHPFSLVLKDSATNRTIYSTKGCMLKYYDKYIQWDAEISTIGPQVVGMGLRADEFVLSVGKIYKMYATGPLPDAIEKLVPAHPFMVYKAPSGRFMGVFAYNSNGQTIQINSYDPKHSRAVISHKFMGGIVSLFFIAPGTAEQVLKTYTNLIGNPSLPPMWSLGIGHDLISAGSDKEYEELLEKYYTEKVPIDSVWGDTNIMYKNRSFTVDTKKFVHIKQFIQRLHKEHKHFIVRADPSISTQDPLYKAGNALNAFLKKGSTKQELKMDTDAGLSTFVDALNPNATQFYVEAVNQLNTFLSSFDGIWLSNNEITTTNNCTGKTFDFHNEDPKSDYRHLFNNPIGCYIYNPYSPTLNSYGYLDVPHYDFHNAYPMFQSKAMRAVLKNGSFVISRGSFTGSGKYASVLTNGLNCETYNMNKTIGMALSGAILGIPHTGTPFKLSTETGQTTQCMWYKVAAFLPLFLTVTSDNDFDLSCGKQSALIRYSLIRYMYTKLYFSNKEGGLSIQPLWLAYNQDPVLPEDEKIVQGFLWGNELYVVNSATKGYAKVYLPKNSSWFVFNDTEVIGKGQYETIHIHKEDYPILLQHKGSIIPIQENNGVLSTYELQEKPYVLSVYPPEGYAKGELILDSGEGSTFANHYTFELYLSQEAVYILKVHRWNKEFYKDYPGLLQGVKFVGKLFDGTESICALFSNLSTTEITFTKINEEVIYLEFKDYISLEELQAILIYKTDKIQNVCKTKLSVQQYKETDHIINATIADIGNPNSKAFYDFKAELITNSTLQLKVDKQAGHKMTVEATEEADTKLVDYGVKIRKDLFTFTIFDGGNKLPLVTTESLDQFKYVDNYVHLPLLCRAAYLYGLAGANPQFQITNGTYNLWNNKDQEGSHGFILMQKHNLEEFMGIFFHSTAPTEVRVKQIGTYYLIDVVILDKGIDLFFIKGHKFAANDVLKEYYGLIGPSIKPLPEWFGGHFGRNYNSLSEAEHDVLNTALFIDYLHLGKNYSQKEVPFSVNNEFHDLNRKSSEFATSYNTYVVVSIPPWISPKNEIDDVEKVCMVSGKTGKTLEGFGDPGKVMYLSFTSTQSKDAFNKLLEGLDTAAEPIGYVMEDNEPYNECDGECPDLRASTFTKRTVRDFAKFPFLYIPRGHSVFENTVSLDAVDSYGSYEIELHQCHAVLQAETLFKKLGNPTKTVPWLSMTTASGPGIGRFSGQILKQSKLSEVYNYQLAGINFVGADICKSSNEFLCAQELEMACVYPFARVFDSPYFPQKAEAYEASMKFRYKNLPYTLHSYMNQLQSGPMLIRPLFFDYPWEVSNCSKTIDYEFMWGKDLLVAFSTAPQVYFPTGLWHCENNLELYTGPLFQTVAKPTTKTPLVFQKEGTVRIHYTAVNERRLSKIMGKPVALKIAATMTGKANGTVRNYHDFSNIDTYTEYFINYSNYSAQFQKVQYFISTHDSLLTEITISDVSADFQTASVLVINCGENCKKTYSVDKPIKDKKYYLRATCADSECANLNEVITIDIVRTQPLLLLHMLLCKTAQIAMKIVHYFLIILATASLSCTSSSVVLLIMLWDSGSGIATSGTIDTFPCSTVTGKENTIPSGSLYGLSFSVTTAKLQQRLCGISVTLSSLENLRSIPSYALEPHFQRMQHWRVFALQLPQRHEFVLQE
eukprot:TRINITY_DN258_c0_g1_i10.p1 TRINITY_DN258_c0_g1~~TRINITY_DN258_c0_g1_i10.p1  ORF type:complete len:1857 (-),score=98.26 TRINITY_DN258_c0_g1_i10:7872-13442(-)